LPEGLIVDPFKSDINQLGFDEVIQYKIESNKNGNVDTTLQFVCKKDTINHYFSIKFDVRKETFKRDRVEPLYGFPPGTYGLSDSIDLFWFQGRTYNYYEKRYYYHNDIYKEDRFELKSIEIDSIVIVEPKRHAFMGVLDGVYVIDNMDTVIVEEKTLYFEQRLISKEQMIDGELFFKEEYIYELFEDELLRSYLLKGIIREDKYSQRIETVICYR